VDAGILVASDRNRIEDNRIDGVLFGIHLRQADANRIRGNRIQSRPAPASLRGDGLRVWYSHDNQIEDNELDQVRDLLLANSPGNRLRGNRIRGSRIGVELVFSPETELLDTQISDGETGLLILYSDDVDIAGNRIRHLRHPPASPSPSRKVRRCGSATTRSCIAPWACPPTRPCFRRTSCCWRAIALPTTTSP
jgi:nitrous oxidase accessory protein